MVRTEIAESWARSLDNGLNPDSFDVRRAGPDRAFEVRRILDGYIMPWFGSQTTTMGDISSFMMHEWLLKLVGRGRGDLEHGPTTPTALRVAETETELWR